MHPSTDSPVYIVGDVHGLLDRLVELLQNAGLINKNQAWSGGEARLWFMGDFFDRGPDGVGVVDLIMRLQAEAPQSGGSVEALVGNHELTILSARFFGERMASHNKTFTTHWRDNGGQTEDLVALTDRHVEWITNLPAMAREGDRLLVHADVLLYTRYGSTIDEVNAAFRALLHNRDEAAWDRILEEFSGRLDFWEKNPDGVANAARFLWQYGGSQIVHGHTPIAKMTGQPDEDVIEPFVYSSGLCVNVDGGMYKGGPGFVDRLPALEGVYV